MAMLVPKLGVKNSQTFAAWTYKAVSVGIVTF